MHNSRLEQYRSPFGAVAVGTTVDLRVLVFDVDPGSLAITLRIWVDGEGETLRPMAYTGGGIWEVQLPCPEPRLVWYSFIVYQAGRPERRLGAMAGHTGGEGVLYERSEVPSFQLTVYEPRTVRPSWYEGGIVYQIFPDRYKRDGAWRERCEAALARAHGKPERRIVDAWDTPPRYTRNADGSIAAWDFYGGSLKGIQDDLDRLHDLGVTAIYLNPVFEAQSNHRYDIGDYLRIDPALGTAEDFRELCAAARERGIRIILDGVFNHTGDDSVYFNRYGTYPGPGAWQALQGQASPWADAFHLKEDGSYACWWGIDNMPQLYPASATVQELLFSDDGVIRHWLREGASGWRLDVADELTEDTLEKIYAAAQDEQPDALVIGEVWEDASNKISYGKPRHYLLGNQLDSAMNYPFRSMIIDFLTGASNAYDAAEVIESLSENYPPQALNCALNLLGSHDRARIVSLLGGAPDPDSLSEAERGAWRIPDHVLGSVKTRYWQAALMQMTLPGVPSIYYGDEAGLQGLTDPFNRATYPWGHEDQDFMTMTRNAANLHRALPFIQGATVRARAINDDTLSYVRHGQGGQDLTFVLNRSTQRAHDVRVPVKGAMAIDLISGNDLPIDDAGNVSLMLYQLSSAAIYTHPLQRLQKPMEPGAGVICHITSLPNEGGHPGTLGAPAKRFVDHLARMGMRYWQVLPVNPTDAWRSPYAGPSAFAGNIDLLDTSKSELFLQFEQLEYEGVLDRNAEFRGFQEANRTWLEPYCAFMAIKDSLGGASRHEWPDELRRYDPRLLEDERFRTLARFHMFCQWRFEKEWLDLLDYAHARGIQIIGDIPMYVSDDSADAWSEPEMFNLDEDGRATQIAGCPPDQFAEDGQIWGNPTYKWDVMKRDGYRWWLARLKRMLHLYDRVRLDHFLGFQSYFSIPAGGTGADGTWKPGPGIELFERAYGEFGPLPFIAEDLGIITPAVRALTATCGFPGMDVLQFPDYDVRSEIRPHAEKILYLSTHDTETLSGWCERSFCSKGDHDGGVRLATDISRRALESKAGVVIGSLQDLLGLGNEARMNVPGVPDGNWSWQAKEADIVASEELIRQFLISSGRAAQGS